jgi:hypothetical protein
MTIEDEIARIRNLSNQAHEINRHKRKVAEDFEKGILTHERLDEYTKEREQLLMNVRFNIKS